MNRTKLTKTDEAIKKNGKIRWIMHAKWSKLTSAEKVAKIALKTGKYALIAAAITTIGTVVIGAVLGIIVAFNVTKEGMVE